MNPFARILRLLPKMIPLGVVTVAVVLAWGRFYQVVGDVVCRVSGALGGSMCSQGELPDAAALLDRLSPTGKGEPAGDDCTSLAGVLSGTGRCSNGGDSASDAERDVLVVGESSTFEYSQTLAAQHPTWDVVGTSLPPATRASSRPNLEFRGGVDATRLGAHFPRNRFSDVVFNAPRALTGWRGPAGDLVDAVLASARDVLRNSGAVRFSNGGGMPAGPRLEGYVANTGTYPLPAGYVRPTKIPFPASEFGVRYTPRDNSGRPLAITTSEMFWYIFPLR
jgi:hypothetical protein